MTMFAVSRLHLTGLVLAGLAFAWSGATVRAADPPLFGTAEIQSQNQAAFPKWKGAVSRYFNEQKLPDAPCESSFFTRCHLKEWKAFLAEQRGRGKRDQVEAVNEFLNKKRYLTDDRNYGAPDYWATPYQFLDRDGDCEDYAIAKYMSLRALGFDNSRMRVVVVKDLNLRLGHAILVVYLDGKALILDNQIREVVESSAIHHYTPVYSINESHWWLHRKG